MKQVKVSYQFLIKRLGKLICCRYCGRFYYKNYDDICFICGGLRDPAMLWDKQRFFYCKKKEMLNRMNSIKRFILNTPKEGRDHAPIFDLCIENEVKQ